MDRYLAALADNPDLALAQPSNQEKPDLSPEAPEGEGEDPTESSNPGDAEQLRQMLQDAAESDEGSIEQLPEEFDSGLEDSPPDNEGYAEIARLARRFAVAVGGLDPPGQIPEILALSAPKIGANLAGGHGLGYDEETICGNIVKCRWALADCEFCREMLEHLVQRGGGDDYRSLVEQSRQLSAQIRERIARLRARVWW